MADAVPLAAALEALLGVQSHDSAVATLRHRRGHLPEAAARSEAEARAGAALGRRRQVEEELAGVVARQDAIEAAIRDLDARIASLDQRLYSGAVTSPKDLQAIESDLASLRARRSEQEDAGLEVLLEREPLDDRMAACDAELGDLAAETARLGAAVEAALAAVDAEIAAHEAARAEGASAIDAALLASYERIRARNRGIGIARLEHGTCMACRMKLPAVDLDRIRNAPAGEAASCPECSAILVR